MSELEADELGRSFSAGLRAAIRDRKMDIRTLCETSGIARSALYRYLDGTRVPTVTRAKMIADALGVGVDELFRGEGGK